MDEESQKFFENHVLSVCAALGGKEGDAYVPGDEVMECLRDLKRFLRMDEQYKERNAHKLLGKWNIIQSDLIPLVLSGVSDENYKLAISACEVMVPLTWPLDDNAEQKERDHYLRYKVAFLQKNIWASILKVIVKLIAVPITKRKDTDHARLRLMFCLIRNILAIEDPKDTTVSSSLAFWTANCHEELVKVMYDEELIEFLLSLGASALEPELRPWNTFLVEIFFHIFYGYRVQDLNPPQTTHVQLSKLQSMMEKEKYSKKVTSTRHSKFGGMFSVKTTSGKQVNMSKLPSQTTYAFDTGKTHKKPRKQNLTLELYTEKNFLNPTSAHMYHKIASNFLENCFNPLLDATKREFDKQVLSLKDENYLHFYFLLGYFFEFYLQNAKEEIELDQITSMINDATVIFILKRIVTLRDEKKWKDLYFCINSFEKFLLVLQKMDGFSVPDIKKASLQVQSKIFYEEAYLEMMVTILKDHQPRARKFLECIVNLVDIVFQLLETNWNSEEGMVVRKKSAMKVPGADVQDSDDEGDYRTSNLERVFSISRFELKFAYENVIDTYCDLLRDFEILSAQTIKNVVRMFNRIIDTNGCNKEALFYSAAYFYLFDEILSNPISQSPAFLKLREFILLITSQAIKRIEEDSLIVLDLFFTKTRGDCARIQDGDGIEDNWNSYSTEELPTSVDLNESFSIPNEDPVLRCDQIRKLSAIVAKSADGDEFLRWLSKSLRCVLYDDLEDLDGLDVSDGIMISHFIEAGAVPSFLDEYIKTETIGMLLHLVGFEKLSEPDTFKYPPNLDLDTIEAVERAKMFSKRALQPPKKSKKKREVVENNLDDFESEVEKPKRKKEQPKLEKQFKSEQFVIDSDDDAEDEAFYAREAELRRQLDECGGNLALLKKASNVAQQSDVDRSHSEDEASDNEVGSKSIPSNMSDQENRPPNVKPRTKLKKKRLSKVHIALDSDSDLEIDILQDEKTKLQPVKRARIVDSDDE